MAPQQLLQDPELSAMAAENARLRELLQAREQQLRGVLSVHALRADCAALLMRRLDEADERDVLEAWAARVRDCELVRDVELTLADGPTFGRLPATAMAPLCVTLPLPNGLGTVRYLRHALPRDPQAAQAQAADLVLDLAVWLQMRRERAQRAAAHREREQREAALHALFEAAPVGLALLDTQLIIQRVNGHWAAITGRAPHFAIGQSLETAYPNDGRTRVAPLLRQVLASGEAVLRRRVALAIVARGGEVRQVELSVVPLRHGDEPPFGLAVVGQDITDGLRAQRDLERLAGQLLRVAEDERRALARDLHDDLGQRLAAAKIHLQMAGRAAASAAATASAAPTTPTASEASAAPPAPASAPASAPAWARPPSPSPAAALEQVRVQAAQAATVLDACIGLVRQWAGQLRPAQLDELGLVAALRAHAHEAAARCGVPVDVAATLPDEALDPGFAVQAFRIVQEGLRNALEHGRPARVSIQLAAEGAPAERALRLTVRDDGAGFGGGPGGAGRAGRAGGGLGVLHMRERTELTGGRFEIRPAAGGGTEVVCVWPLARLLAPRGEEGHDAGAAGRRP